MVRQHTTRMVVDGVDSTIIHEVSLVITNEISMEPANVLLLGNNCTSIAYPVGYDVDGKRAVYPPVVFHIHDAGAAERGNMVTPLTLVEMKQSMIAMRMAIIIDERIIYYRLEHNHRMSTQHNKWMKRESIN
jgi:hypothetical protein